MWWGMTYMPKKARNAESRQAGWAELGTVGSLSGMKETPARTPPLSTMLWMALVRAAADWSDATRDRGIIRPPRLNSEIFIWGFKVL